MKTIKFWKMSGSGNDFVVIDNRKKLINGNASAWAQRLCYRQEGVGADGLLLLEPAGKVKSKTNRPAFRMAYYNADGSRASMCGNGARCMAWFAHAQGAVGNEFSFVTDAYPVNARVQGTRVRVTLANAQAYRSGLAVRVGSKTMRVASLNTGVPHAVVFVPTIKNADVHTLGRALRYHNVFAPRGTNVNFVQKLGPHRLQVRTYERGVEGETLACGTGVAASAIAAVLEGHVKTPVQCVTAGGDTLTVNFKVTGSKEHARVSDISLAGPVRLIFKGEVRI